MLCKETEIGRLGRSPSSCNTPLARVEMWSKASGSRLIFLKPLAYMVSLKHSLPNLKGFPLKCTAAFQWNSQWSLVFGAKEMGCAVNVCHSLSRPFGLRAKQTAGKYPWAHFLLLLTKPGNVLSIQGAVGVPTVLMNHGDPYSWDTRLGSPYLVRKR